ncbi:EMI domain-containing protein 1 [Labeo rohita]|uniref:EMI domain-containing protein 1 n=1 Tax=Labeo rohita TaxID=84645 RepID=A0ABQ8MPK6_LABRO|nr:EMI domain-containing protein 1 [Labeo rohita]
MGDGIHQIREALKILAERVLILETMIGIHGPGVRDFSASFTPTTSSEEQSVAEDRGQDFNLKKFQDLQADLELLARRVQLLEAIIWPGNARLPSSSKSIYCHLLAEPDLGSGDGLFGTPSPDVYRIKRARMSSFRVNSPLITAETKVRGK